MVDAKDIQTKFEQLRRKYRERDQRWMDVRAVRRGHLEEVFEGIQSEMFPKPIIANFIDQCARDLTEVIAPLPSFNCSSSTMKNDKARGFADKRTKIANYYVEHSKVDVQAYTSTDQYLTYGLAIAVIEPDFDHKCPRITFDDPMGAYPEWDRWGRLVSYTKCFKKPGWLLAQEFPEYAAKLTKDSAGRYIGDQDVEMIRYVDKDKWVLMLPGSIGANGQVGQPTVLASAGNLIKRMSVVIARKPTLDYDDHRGQFDEVIWIQIARDMMAKLNIEAVYKSVNAPLAVPPDLQDFPLGADALLRTNNPEKIRRVGIELPQGAMAEGQLLNQEMHEGARYPQARTGNPDASIITGRGVQALMGGFDTQVKSAQTVFARMFREIIEICFDMDEKLWPDEEKEIRGQVAGSPYNVKYKPSKDIDGDHSCDVSFGFMAGLDPNRALVFMLQLRGDKAISRDALQRALPINVDVGEEQRKVDVEETRDALKQALFQYAATIPQMAQAAAMNPLGGGGTPPGESLQKIAEIIKAIQNGKPIEEAILIAFPPPPPQPEAPAEAPQSPLEALTGGGGGEGTGEALPGAPGGGGGPFGQIAPGQAEMGPGGRPDLQTMLAGLSASGKPNLQASVQRRMPA